MTEGELIRRTGDVRWLGRFGEDIWKNVLEASGWRYIALADMNGGGAPMAKHKTGKTILPDFHAARSGRDVFIDSKVKSQSKYFWTRSQERHGIDKRNHQHYLKMAEQFGKNCFIGIVELQRELSRDASPIWSGSLLLGKLGNLGVDYPDVSNGKNPSEMVYWNRKEFSEVDNCLTAQELWDISTGRLVKSYEYTLEKIICPLSQKGLFTD